MSKETLKGRRCVEIDGTEYEFKENKDCPLSFMGQYVLCCNHPDRPIINMICNDSPEHCRAYKGEVQP